MQKRGDFGVALLLGPSQRGRPWRTRQRLDRGPVLQEQSGEPGQAVAAGVAQRRGLEFVVAVRSQQGLVVAKERIERQKNEVLFGKDRYIGC